MSPPRAAISRPDSFCLANVRRLSSQHEDVYDLMLQGLEAGRLGAAKARFRQREMSMMRQE